jgi:hypothetical protein
MPFPISVLDPKAFPAVKARRVTLVHFARAVDGFADASAPDLDTRGNVLRAAPGAAYGPATGIAGKVSGKEPREVRIKLVRDRIDAAAKLFPEIENTGLVSLVYPTTGVALNPADTPTRTGDCIYLKANSDGAGDPETKLKIRYGTATGPVIAELAIAVYKPVTIYVKIHRVTINGPASASNPVDAECAYTNGEIAAVIDRMNRIMEPAGMIYVPRATIATEVLDNYTERGTVTLTNVGDQVNVELQKILNTNPDPDSLNVYLFNRFRDVTQSAGNDLGVLGIAMSRDDANANPPTTAFPGCQAGFTLRYSGDLELAAHTAAHEIGHTLRLQHYGGRGPMSKMKDEIWANRNLMRNTVNLAANKLRSNIGYGAFAGNMVRAGSWLGTKTFPATANLGQSNQIAIARAAAAADSYKPVARS